MPNNPGLLVTGASGFVGRRAVTLGRERFSVIATGRGSRPAWVPEDVEWLTIDLLDRSSVIKMPDDIPFVLHLASETVPSKFSCYDPLLDSVEMTLNLCRHLRLGRLLLASSCLVYGISKAPLTEDAPVDPRGGYGLAKALCETIVSRPRRLDMQGRSLETIIARPFNHIGAGMRPDLVIPSIVRRLRDAADGETITMNGLDSVRDFLDVDDIVEAYFALLEMPLPTTKVFNVASGRPTSISEVVRTAARVLGKSIGGISFTASANSADDTDSVVGNADLLRMATDWTPRYGLEDSVRKLVAGSSKV